MPFITVNTPVSGSNAHVAASSTQQLITVTGTAQQTSDTFLLPPQIARPGARFKVHFNGVIVQGASAAAAVLYGNGGSPQGNNALLPVVTVPASLMAVSQSYAVDITWEWTCQAVSGALAQGYISVNANLTLNGLTLAAPLGSVIGLEGWQLDYAQPLGGSNVQPNNFYVTVDMGTGVESYPNYTVFEWSDGLS